MKKYTLSAFICFFTILFFSCTDSNDVSPSVDSGTGQGGSMARFAITGDYLYVVDHSSLHVYTLADPRQPVKTTEVSLGVDIETIFPSGNKLYIGSMDGMHIYDITAPDKPVHLSTYQHIRSCDPVVVQGDLAYVTLRAARTCGGGVNRLDIIDISDPVSPRLISSREMDNPFGLGIDGNTLFVCEGEMGLKVLDVADPQNIQLIRQIDNMHSFDVIPASNNLILTGNEGVFQYDYTEVENLKLNSRLSSVNCE